MESESERDKHCWSGRAPWTLFMLTETLWILITETFQKNNYPLVQFHCIIKIMCQGLPLGCLQCLLVCTVQDRNFGCSARFYIFSWHIKRFWFFLQCIYIQLFLFFLILVEFLGYQKYGECSDCYRLFYFWQILFLMHSLLVLMKLSISISGLRNQKAILQ